MSAEISIFDNIFQSKGGGIITIIEFIDRIKHGTWKEIALKINQEEDKKQRTKIKEKLPYVTISGRFEHRQKDELIKHSGFICMDFDQIENMEESFLKFSNDPFTYACFKSVSGRGLAVIVKIDGRRHLDAYLGLESYYAKKYQEYSDRSCKDTTRARYVSYDPNTYINENSERFTVYLPKSDTVKKIPNVISCKSDLDHIIKQVYESNVDLTQSSYFRFLEIGFSIASEYKEEGREYFHQIAQFSDKYSKEKTDKQYTHCLKSGGQGITIGTLMYYAKEAGLSIVSPLTKHIITVSAMGKKAGRSLEETIEILEKVDGITEDQSREVIEKTYAHEDVSSSLKLSNIESLEIFLNSYYNLKKNEITRVVENNGQEIDTNFMNSIYIRARKEIDDKIKHDEIDRLINSDFTPTYNPLKEFFEKNCSLLPSSKVIDLANSGLIVDLANSIETDTGLTGNCFYPDYKYNFLRKWLVGIVASIHGDHSPQLLVLTGGQGTGKTEFFRRLLPQEMKEYFAESKLDAGKDDEILMTQKILICDDEFGGKNKMESKRLKELTSKEYFTLREPYGRKNVRLKRLAVLCGTSNEDMLLSDPTGNRRIIPLRVISIDHDRFNAIDKKTLFMEAYYLWSSGFSWQLNKEDVKILGENTAEFEQVRFENEMLQRYLKKTHYKEPGDEVVFMQASDIKAYIDKLTGQRISIWKIGAEMKSLGFDQVAKRIQGYGIRRGYDVILMRETDTHNEERQGGLDSQIVLF